MEAVKNEGPYKSIQHGVPVVHDWPPNIDAIRAVLPVTSRNIFAYDRKIYNPGGGRLPPELVAHERVHFRQHSEYKGGFEAWWERFLTDKKFRLDQEIPAHQVEWRSWLSQRQRTRQERRAVLKIMAKRLSAPMYGKIISMNQAKRVIQA